MWISRVRVTGGFLNGLDVHLNKGLNVIVGARGAGKTTFLELLRHALGAQHAERSANSERDRKLFLEAVLGSGEIVLDVESSEGDRHLVVDSSGGGRRQDMARSVVVLGQNELEEIASDAPSRLALLDLRTGTAKTFPIRDEARLLTADIYKLRAQLSDLGEAADKRNRLVADRNTLLAQEAAALTGNAGQLTDEREKLRIIEDAVIQTGQDLDRAARLRSDLMDVLGVYPRQIENLRAAAERAQTLTTAPAIYAGLTKAVDSLTTTDTSLRRVVIALSDATAELREQNIAAREAAAPLREALEEAEAGLGQITAQLRNVNTEIRALDESDQVMKELEKRLSNSVLVRNKHLDAAEVAEEALYASRADVAQVTTSQIANNVVVVVHHLADSEDFRHFLLDSLKGTNTRTSVIDTVAERVLPRQLLELVEARDVAGLSIVTGLARDRVERLIDHLSRQDILESLATVSLADSVDFRLRDGVIDKSVDVLSTGQKCAVTLPIVLSERERTLILDQPEDHLDNAYLVTNVVSGIAGRTLAGAQTIIATHNANIPVLGSADKVIVLASNGESGDIDVQGAYDDLEVVERITRLMEGGREAFARRSAFYSEHGGLQ